MLELLPIRDYCSFLLRKEDLENSIINYVDDILKLPMFECRRLNLHIVEFGSSTLYNLQVGVKGNHHKLVIDVSEHGYKLYTMPSHVPGLFNNIRPNKIVTVIQCPDFESVIDIIVNKHKDYRSFFRRVVDKLFQVDRVDANTLVEVNYTKYKPHLDIKHSFYVVSNTTRSELFDTFISGLNFERLVMLDATTYMCYNSKEAHWYIINLRYKRDIAKQDGYIYNIYQLSANCGDIFQYSKLKEDSPLKEIGSEKSLDEKIMFLQHNILLDITSGKIYVKTH